MLANFIVFHNIEKGILWFAHRNLIPSSQHNFLDPSHDPNCTEEHLPGAVHTARESKEARQIHTTLQNGNKQPTGPVSDSEAQNPGVNVENAADTNTTPVSPPSSDPSLRQQPEGDSEPEPVAPPVSQQQGE